MMEAENDESPLPSFTIPWVKSFMDGYFQRKGKDPTKIDIIDLKIQKNSIQGILSTAYLIDVMFKDLNPPLGMYGKNFHNIFLWRY